MNPQATLRCRHWLTLHSHGGKCFKEHQLSCTFLLYTQTWQSLLEKSSCSKVHCIAGDHKGTLIGQTSWDGMCSDLSCWLPRKGDMHMAGNGPEEDGEGNMDKGTWSQRIDLGGKSRGEASSPHAQSAKRDLWPEK